jgi:protein phosphatase methylesterase 1
MKKQLILAGSERMDKELTIAQMQGKFSMKVIHDCGHVVQED